uniref:Transmembrane protein 169 n=1 Tax=Triatoma infestans TaxID=30076 RepID=A0A170Y320_TRIIF
MEKGFIGWFCSIIKLEECSPYEVVVLTDIKVSSDQEKCNSQDSILT